jgi:hypothetical protein
MPRAPRVFTKTSRRPLGDPELDQRLPGHAETQCLTIESLHHPSRKVDVDPPCLAVGTSSFRPVDVGGNVPAFIVFAIEFLSFHSARSPRAALCARKSIPPLGVNTAVQCRPAMVPMARNRGSSVTRAGASSKNGSFQSACASTKSIPCLTLFVELFAASNSNSMANNGAISLHFQELRRSPAFDRTRRSDVAFLVSGRANMLRAARVSQRPPIRSFGGSKTWRIQSPNPRRAEGLAPPG